MPLTEPAPLQLADYPELLTPAEFQSITRLSRTTVYDLLRREQIPGVLRFGRAIRIPRAAINSFAGTRASR